MSETFDLDAQGGRIATIRVDNKHTGVWADGELRDKSGGVLQVVKLRHYIGYCCTHEVVTCILSQLLSEEYGEVWEYMAHGAGLYCTCEDD